MSNPLLQNWGSRDWRLRVKDFGRQKKHNEIYRGSECAVDFLLKIKIEIMFADAQVAAVVNAIMKAHPHPRNWRLTGLIGDCLRFETD
jgi:nitrogen regulatory protein PII